MRPWARGGAPLGRSGRDGARYAAVEKGGAGRAATGRAGRNIRQCARGPCRGAGLSWSRRGKRGRPLRNRRPLGMDAERGEVGAGRGRSGDAPAVSGRLSGLPHGRGPSSMSPAAARISSLSRVGGLPGGWTMVQGGGREGAVPGYAGAAPRAAPLPSDRGGPYQRRRGARMAPLRDLGRLAAGSAAAEGNGCRRATTRGIGTAPDRGAGGPRGDAAPLSSRTAPLGELDPLAADCTGGERNEVDALARGASVPALGSREIPGSALRGPGGPAPDRTGDERRAARGTPSVPVGRVRLRTDTAGARPGGVGPLPNPRARYGPRLRVQLRRAAADGARPPATVAPAPAGSSPRPRIGPVGSGSGKDRVP